MHPEYRGKPVVTGKERNIVAAASYEAKAKGIKRGVALWDVKKLCPDCIILPSDYETYSIYSLRMFSILRRYSPLVEEASIDEAYVDLTGVARYHRKGYKRIAMEMQRAVRDELGIGISIGVGLSKSIAKLASKYRKPAGITAVSSGMRSLFLKTQKVGNVCGIGPSAQALLAKQGIVTADDFARLPEGLVKRMLGKLGVELWFELNGAVVRPVTTEETPPRQSIMKSKTFAPPSRDRNFIRAQWIRNLESACIKARRHGLLASRVALFLRKNDFDHVSDEVKLIQKSSLPNQVIPLLDPLFAELFDPRIEYRATGVILSDLACDAGIQYSLFDDPSLTEKKRDLYDAVGELGERYGKHTVSSGASLYLRRDKKTSRADAPARKKNLLKGETFRRRLNVPLWDVRL